MFNRHIIFSSKHIHNKINIPFCFYALVTYAGNFFLFIMSRNHYSYSTLSFFVETSFSLLEWIFISLLSQREPWRLALSFFLLLYFRCSSFIISSRTTFFFRLHLVCCNFLVASMGKHLRFVRAISGNYYFIFIFPLRCVCPFVL